MNRLAKLMIRLYPTKWRARYGDEMDALLSDTGADARVVTDLMAGGIRMQFSTWPFPKLALALSLLGILLGAGASFLITPQYVSSAVLELSPGAEVKQPTGSTRDLNSRISELTQACLSKGVLYQIINDPGLNLYSQERKVVPLEDVIQQMRRDISIQIATLPGQSAIPRSAFAVSFLYSDRAKAQQTLQAIVARLMEENLRRTRSPVFFSVIDTPNLPTLRYFQHPRMILLYGFVVGLLIAFIWRLAGRRNFVARRFAMSLVAFGIAGSVVAGLADVATLFQRRFVSTGTVQIQAGTPEQQQALVSAMTDEQALTAVIRDPKAGLYRDELRKKSVADVVQSVRQHLQIVKVASVASDSDGLLLRISFEDSDRFRAQQTVSGVIAGLSTEINRLHPDLSIPPRLRQPSTLAIIDAPSMPFLPIKPNRSVVAGIGGVVGVFTAAVIALIRRRWSPDTSVPVEALNG